MTLRGCLRKDILLSKIPGLKMSRKEAGQYYELGPVLKRGKKY
jgi:hypothetical protein